MLEPRSVAAAAQGSGSSLGALNLLTLCNIPPALNRCDRPFRRALQDGSQGTAAAAGGGGVWKRCPHTSQGGQRRHR